MIATQSTEIDHPAAVVTVRPAALGDVAGIVALVQENVKAGHLLPRTAEEVAASIDNWIVAADGAAIVGIGSLLLMNPDLVEVRSLAVDPAYRTHGLGAKIVLGLVEKARQRKISTVFALTRAVSFFTRLGFVVTDKERFPEKVWRDCVKCPLVTCCDETAVVLE
ncbi:MAG TPA: GNAT family N-acetyltransferase [Herpetosiphonaceae bacterium]